MSQRKLVLGYRFGYKLHTYHSYNSITTKNVHLYGRHVQAHLKCHTHLTHRYYSSKYNQYSKDLQMLGENFQNARDEIEEARESLNTRYFNEDFFSAQRAVEETLNFYGDLLEKMDSESSAKLQREQHPKIQQLKEELEILKESAVD
eukprot:TRINITY_DN11353_c0_g1_i1.p1 TRINITY_DN11353_c0_g1~~TRINITY_DN11353_c0_g1_i1.p1  ORF type:complete len:147 (+),score=11.77 TRINITY_DN11353_c0_g1_i1:48-488(+)